MFLKKKTDSEHKQANDKIKYIKREMSKEEEDKKFENQTPELVKAAFIQDIKKIIEALKVENITESHRTILALLSEEVNKNLSNRLMNISSRE